MSDTHIEWHPDMTPIEVREEADKAMILARHYYAEARRFEELAVYLRSKAEQDSESKYDE